MSQFMPSVGLALWVGLRQETEAHLQGPNHLSGGTVHAPLGCDPGLARLWHPDSRLAPTGPSQETPASSTSVSA